VLFGVVASDGHCELLENPVTPPALILILLLHYRYCGI
jgi:hypothetical protein